MAERGEARLRALAEAVVAVATACGLTVATAESCTAGLIASTLGAVPGASSVLRGGAVTYCNDVKHRVLGVRDDTLAAHTAVSAPCACEMASGARELLGADFAVSATGYAGPGPGERGEPAGTVYLGLADEEGACAEKHVFPGERNEVRAAAAARALELLLAAVRNR